MCRVRLTAVAEEARVNIWLHIARDNPIAADRIDERCHLYTSQPLAGEVRTDLGASLRCLSVGEYVVIYRPAADGIEVLLVIHGARDIPVDFRRLFHHDEP